MFLPATVLKMGKAQYAKNDKINDKSEERVHIYVTVAKTVSIIGVGANCGILS
jgi:hypothetical protein